MVAHHLHRMAKIHGCEALARWNRHSQIALVKLLVGESGPFVPENNRGLSSAFGNPGRLFGKFLGKKQLAPLLAPAPCGPCCDGTVGYGILYGIKKNGLFPDRCRVDCENADAGVIKIFLFTYDSQGGKRTVRHGTAYCPDIAAFFRPAKNDHNILKIHGKTIQFFSVFGYNSRMEKQLFNGRKSLVIGGTGGIGRQIALQLADSGAEVWVMGRHRSEDIQLHTIQADFDRGGLSELSRPDVREILSQCEICAVTYGPFLQKPVHEMSAEEWSHIAIADYALPGAVVSAVLPGMIERKWGRILLFGGTRTESVRSYRTNAAYAGAKTGISVIIKSVSAEYKEYGITCNGILPGFTRNAPSEEYLVEESWVAEQGIHLISSEKLNGVLLNADCGWQPR